MFLEKKMGDVIDFRQVKDCARLRPPSEGTAEIVTFTGGWHRPMSIRGTKSQSVFVRCRRRIVRSLAPFWAVVSASLRSPDNQPGAAVQEINLETNTSLGQAEWSGASSKTGNTPVEWRAV
jgi:hypothetical protein